MKKILTLLLGIILLPGCAKDDKSEAVPMPPENLTGEVISTTAINLTWTDRSANETGFKIERKKGTETYAVIGTTETNVTIFNDTEFAPNTTYTYRVYSYNSGGNSPTYSNEISLTTTAILPTVITTAVTGISGISASSGGNISSDGGAAITARGVCWSTNSNPTTANSKTTNIGTTGTFTSNITGLIPNTIYYIRAYAKNSAGTSYGTEISFVTLTEVSIGTQIWTTKNLDITTYRDGTQIPQVTDPTAWSKLTTGAWCYYNNNSVNGITYGKLYNWYAVAGIHDNDPNTPNKILAPTGWHVPSDAEWTTLTTYLGGKSVAGGKMKSTGNLTSGTGLWSGGNTDATNSSGFTALPGGWCNISGTFTSISNDGRWWSSSDYNPADTWGRDLSQGTATVSSYNYNKTYGFSVRCLKD
jgi:uncharacterized protein (TIGR02145 family)